MPGCIFQMVVMAACQFPDALAIKGTWGAVGWKVPDPNVSRKHVKLIVSACPPAHAYIRLRHIDQSTGVLDIYTKDRILMRSRDLNCTRDFKELGFTISQLAHEPVE